MNAITSWVWQLRCGDCIYSFYQHHECQKEVLRRQVAIALELNLPLVIHSRDSEQDMIDELEKVQRYLKVAKHYRITRVMIPLEVSATLN